MLALELEEHHLAAVSSTCRKTMRLVPSGRKTKHKIAKVSKAELELYERDLTLEIRGSEKQRRAARKYSQLSQTEQYEFFFRRTTRFVLIPWRCANGAGALYSARKYMPKL